MRAPHDIRIVPEQDYLLVVRYSETLARETDPAAITAFNRSSALAALRHIARDPFGRVLGAYTSGELAGILILGGVEMSEWNGGRYLLITSFFVSERHRGQGVGRALYAAAERTARSLGTIGLQLHVREDNLRAQ
jgi:GNAT superfamily N-acetyltransferase